MCHRLGVEQLLQEQGVDKEEIKASLIQKQNKYTWNVNSLRGKIYLHDLLIYPENYQRHLELGFKLQRKNYPHLPAAKIKVKSSCP